MDKKKTQNLLGHVSRWQMETIEILKANDCELFDMVWLFQGGYYKDCRYIYASRSDYFKCLFLSQMKKGTEEFDGVTAYRVSDPMSKKHIFDMMRIYCHTGIVQVDKGEPILKTMERYTAFHYYNLRGGMDVIRQLVMDSLNPTNAVQALEYAMKSAVCSSDTYGASDRETGLLSDIKDYIAIYAFVVFKHRSFYTIDSETIAGVSHICTRDDLNIKEIDLLHCIYKLCERKVSMERNLEGPRSSWELMTHEYSGQGTSLWSQIRLSSISLKEFVKFIKENKTCFSSDDVVKIITFLYSCCEASEDKHVAGMEDDKVTGMHLSKKRKTFRPISFYPRNLEFHGLGSPQTDISYWDDSKIKLFVAFDSSCREAMALPPVHFHNFFVHCTVYHADKSLNISGNIHGKVGLDDSSVKMTVTTSVVNFRHDRWRKKSVTTDLVAGRTFVLPTILSWNTISNSDTPGYLFDLERYPEYCPNGSWIMMSLCMEK